MGGKMKKGLYIFIGILIITQIGLLPSFAKDVIKLNLAHLVPETHPVHKSAELFKKMVEELTQGRVQITIYPANTFAPVVEAVEEVMRGTLDMEIVTPGGAQTHIPELAVCMVPFAFDNQGHADRVWHGPALERIREIYKKNNIVVHWPGIWGFRQMTNNKRPIYGPEDVKGLKMRVPPELQLMNMYQALGAVTTTIAFGELYLALSQGVADGQCNPLWVFKAFKLDEVQKYVALTDHAYQVMFIYKSLDMWKRLPPDIKRAIEIADRVAMDYLRELTFATEKSIIKSLQERKDIIVTKPDRRLFAEKMGPVYKAIAKYAGEEWFNEWMGYIEEARLR